MVTLKGADEANNARAAELELKVVTLKSAEARAATLEAEVATLKVRAEARTAELEAEVVALRAAAAESGGDTALEAAREQLAQSEADKAGLLAAVRELEATLQNMRDDNSQVRTRRPLPRAADTSRDDARGHGIRFGPLRRQPNT
eukprot:5949812-Pyramimonas_sp.AAC.1